MNCCVRLKVLSTVYITRQLVWDRRIELPSPAWKAGIITIRPIPHYNVFQFSAEHYNCRFDSTPMRSKIQGGSEPIEAPNPSSLFSLRNGAPLF